WGKESTVHASTVVPQNSQRSRFDRRVTHSSPAIVPPALCYNAVTMTDAHFTRWLTAYGRAWETGDAAAVVGLFAPDAAYHETPFDPPMVGLEALAAYWREGAGQGQRDVSFHFEVLRSEERRVGTGWRGRRSV